MVKLIFSVIVAFAWIEIVAAEAGVVRNMLSSLGGQRGGGGCVNCGGSQGHGSQSPNNYLDYWGANNYIRYNPSPAGQQSSSCDCRQPWNPPSCNCGPPKSPPPCSCSAGKPCSCSPYQQHYPAPAVRNNTCNYLGCPQGFALFDLTNLIPGSEPFCAAQNITLLGGVCPPGCTIMSNINWVGSNGVDYSCYVKGALTARIGQPNPSQNCYAPATPTYCCPTVFPAINSFTNCPNAFTLMDFSYVPNSNIGLTCVTLASYFEGTCPTYNNGGKVTVTCSAYLSNLTGSDDACLLKGALDGLYDMPNLSQACCTLPFNYSST